MQLSQTQGSLWDQLIAPVPTKVSTTFNRLGYNAAKGVRALSHANIKPLFAKLKDHEHLLKHLDSDTTPNVFKGQFYTIEGLLCVKVSVFKIKSYEDMDLHTSLESKRIKASVDWIDDNILWFRRTPTGYESFIDYIDEYRDHFVVEGLSPSLELTVSLPDQLQ